MSSTPTPAITMLSRKGQANEEEYFAFGSDYTLCLESKTTAVIYGCRIPLDGRWVLRRAGEYIDSDLHRHTVAERNNVKFWEMVPSFMKQPELQAKA